MSACSEFSVAHFAFLFLAGMSMFRNVVSQQEFPAGCGSPADVQVGALAETDPRARSAVKDFMATLDEPKAQWGSLHMTRCLQSALRN